MTADDWARVTPDAVLDFWFPDNGHWQSPETHLDFWRWRMQGGADDDICARFSAVTEAAARGLLDHWVAVPRGWLALLMALDQFPRSVWRETPGAYAQDIRAADLALASLRNGDWASLDNVWEKQFVLISIGHAEGPGHLGRIERVLAAAMVLVDEAPQHLRPFYLIGADQNLKVRDIITRFGRHPHRNGVLGRVSTPQEEEYIAAGVFPHQRQVDTSPDGFAAEIDRIKARLAAHVRAD